MNQHDARRLPASLVPPVLAGWLAYLVIDFLMHAVLLVPWWRVTESYWLPPEALFRRIPYAYLAFAIYVACLMWLLVRLFGSRPTMRSSLCLGAIAGVLFGSASVLATYSVFPMPRSSLLVWPASATVASLGGAAAGGWTLAAAKPWKRVLIILLSAIALFIIGVLLQNGLPARS